MGQNIGTCVSAMISSIGAGKNAKRAAVIHLSFNVISTVVLLSLYNLADLIIGFEFVEQAADPLGIAVVHTVFKILALLLLMPLSKQLEKLACFLVKDSKEEMEKDEEFKVLDDRFIHSPTFAIEQCKKLTDNMARITRDAMLSAVQIADKYDEELDKFIYETESRIDNYEDKLGTYLVKISANELSAEDGKNISTLLHCIGDFERISDHATNIVKASKEMKEKNISFSGNAEKELEVMRRAVADVLNLTVDAFINNDLELAHKIEPLEEVIDSIKTRLKSRHVKRLRDGECTIELGFVLTDYITNFERVSDHCSNIAVCLIQMADANYEVHDYIHELKASGEEFDRMVAEYQEIYALPPKNV